MSKFKKEKYIFWHSPIALILLFLILIFFGYRIIDLTQKERETSHKKELILDQIDSLKQRQDSLNKDIAKINTDEGKEEIIREKYQVAKSGEKMVTIVDEEASKEAVAQENEKLNHGFWNWIKRTFHL